MTNPHRRLLRKLINYSLVATMVLVSDSNNESHLAYFYTEIDIKEESNLDGLGNTTKATKSTNLSSIFHLFHLYRNHLAC